MATKPKGNPFARQHLRATYRSGLEVAVGAALALAGVVHTYETLKLPFVEPAKKRTYCPDFILENGVVVETKGLFVAADRAKHLMVRAAHPDIDVRFCFTNPSTKITKGSNTTYADWCVKNGYKYCKKEIPQAWIEEPPNERSVASLSALGWKPSD